MQTQLDVEKQPTSAQVKKTVRILSLDGGGMRGIIPATVLKYVESYLQKRWPNTTLADHFDMIAGTSTGGILAAIYLTPEHAQKGSNSSSKFSTKDALDFYIKEGYQIFNASKRPKWKGLWGLGNAVSFNPNYLEGLLHEQFGDLLMSQLLKPCLITTYNINNQSPFFFTSTEDTNEREFYVRDVLRSTSAAPTYFPPATVKNLARIGLHGKVQEDMINLDGGVFANNPAMCAYAEARNTRFETRNNHFPSASDIHLLSIGTGGGGFQLKKKDKSHKWGLLKWAKSLPEIMMDADIDAVGYQVNEIYETLPSNALGKYLRLDVPYNERNYSSDMADASPRNVEKLLEAGKKTLEKAIQNGLPQFLDGLSGPIH